MSTVRRVLRSLHLGKIAAVDTPCQEGAKVTILKRAPTDRAADIAKLKAGFADAIGKSGLLLDGPDVAQDFDEVIGERVLTDAFWNDYYQATSALQASLTSIVNDDTVTDKPALVTEALQQFADYVEQMMPGDIGKSLTAGIAVTADTFGPTLKGATMSDAIKKALGLPATATEADVTKAIADAAALAKMSDKHKAFMENDKAKMPTGGKTAFMGMEPAERDAHMKANPIDGDDDGDDDAIEKSIRSGAAFKAADGTVIHKARVGDAVFAVMKSQNDQLAKQAADLAKAADEKAAADFTKRAETAGFEPEFGATMRKAYSGRRRGAGRDREAHEGPAGAGGSRRRVQELSVGRAPAPVRPRANLSPSATS